MKSLSIISQKKILIVAAGIVLLVALVTLGRLIAQKPPHVRSEKTPPHGIAGIDTKMAAASGIRLTVAASADIDETITLYGFVKPNANRQQELRARYPGVVRSITVQPGDKVAAGTVLATIESNESLQTYTIRAPITGTVLTRNINPGSAVGNDAALLTIADLSSLWAEFAIFSRDIGKFKSGLPVRVINADGSLRSEGNLDYVAPAGDSESQSVVARVNIDNRDGRWVGGQFATAEVVIRRTHAAVSVEPSALQSMNGKDVVFVQVPGGFAPREVSVGLRARDRVAITAGLKPGEKYAAENSYLVKAELLKGETDED